MRHNEKVTKIKRHHQLDCNCCIKTKCPPNGYCQEKDVTHKCISLTPFQPPKKILLALQRVTLKSKDYITTSNHFETKTITSLSSYVWKIKKRRRKPQH